MHSQAGSIAVSTQQSRRDSTSNTVREPYSTQQSRRDGISVAAVAAVAAVRAASPEMPNRTSNTTETTRDAIQSSNTTETTSDTIQFSNTAETTSDTIQSSNTVERTSDANYGMYQWIQQNELNEYAKQPNKQTEPRMVVEQRQSTAAAASMHRAAASTTPHGTAVAGKQQEEPKVISEGVTIASLVPDAIEIAGSTQTPAAHVTNEAHPTKQVDPDADPVADPDADPVGHCRGAISPPDSAPIPTPTPTPAPAPAPAPVPALPTPEPVPCGHSRLCAPSVASNQAVSQRKRAGRGAGRQMPLLSTQTTAPSIPTSSFSPSEHSKRSRHSRHTKTIHNHEEDEYATTDDNDDDDDDEDDDDEEEDSDGEMVLRVDEGGRPTKGRTSATSYNDGVLELEGDDEDSIISVQSKAKGKSSARRSLARGPRATVAKRSTASLCSPVPVASAPTARPPFSKAKKSSGSGAKPKRSKEIKAALTAVRRAQPRGSLDSVTSSHDMPLFVAQYRYVVHCGLISCFFCNEGL